MTLPPQWAATELGTLVTFVRGVTYKKEQTRDTPAPGYVPILRAGNLQDGRIVWNDLVYAPSECVSDVQRLRAGDIVVAMSSGSASVVGKAAAVTLIDVTHGAAFGAFCGVWRPTASEVAAWTAAFFQSAEYRSAASAAAAGVNINNLRADHITGMRLALPPANEQQRITAKLSELGARSRRAKESLDAVPPLLDKLRQSILAAAFRGDLTADWRARNPDVEPADKLLARIRAERRARWEAAELAKLTAKGKPPTDQRWKARYEAPTPADEQSLPPLPTSWAWMRVEELATKVVDGVHKKPSYVPTGIPFLTVKNLTAGPGISFDSLNYITQADHEEYTKRTDPEPGDLLISKDGTLGITRLVTSDRVFSIFVSLALVKPVLRMMGGFLELAFQSPVFQERFVSTGSGLQHIHLRDLRDAVLPIAPLAEQEELTNRVRAALARVEQLEARLAEAGETLAQMDQAILSKAFRGALVPQDPNDEPAALLLKRVHGARGEGNAAPRPRAQGGSLPIPEPAEPQPALAPTSLLAHTVSALWPHGPLDKDAAIRCLADHLRDAGLITFQRLRADGPLYAQVADAIEAAVKAGHLDRPRRGQVRACKSDATAYTADDWRHALLAVLGPSPTDRDDAIRAAAEWARDNCGLEFTRLRADGHIVTGLRSALTSAIRRGEIERHGADRIARANEPPAKGQLSFADVSLPRPREPR